MCVCVQVVRKKKRSWLTKYVFPVLEGVGHAVGIVTFVCSLCLYGFGVVMLLDLALYSREMFLLQYTANWLLTNFVTYVVWDFFVYFNPFVCCAPSPPPAADDAQHAGSLPPRRARGQLRAGSVRDMIATVWGAAGRCLLWVGLAQWQVERLRAGGKLREAMRPEGLRARRLQRVLSKPKLSVEIKKFQ